MKEECGTPHKEQSNRTHGPTLECKQQHSARTKTQTPHPLWPDPTLILQRFFSTSLEHSTFSRSIRVSIHQTTNNEHLFSCSNIDLNCKQTIQLCNSLMFIFTVAARSLYILAPYVWFLPRTFFLQLVRQLIYQQHFHFAFALSLVVQCHFYFLLYHLFGSFSYQYYFFYLSKTIYTVSAVHR